jgi:hypothetical protein
MYKREGKQKEPEKASAKNYNKEAASSCKCRSTTVEYFYCHDFS